MNFDVDIAIKYGVDESIMISMFVFWISKNKANGKHNYENRTWTYNSLPAYAKLFPFWTEKQIRRVILSLKDQDIIVTGNFNKTCYDHTTWYAFKDESAFLPNNLIDLPKRDDQGDQTGSPIPVILPVNKKNDVTGIFSDKSPEYKLSEIMLSKIKSNGSSMKDPDIQKWSKIFDFIHRIDKRDYDWIVELIDLVYKDNFWKNNIRSPEKLREQINTGKLDKLICMIKDWSTDEQVIEALNA